MNYEYWGDIDGQTHAQMARAAAHPYAVAAALMPDGHLGYGLPIGGVLATDGVVIPYAVGFDIACRMRLTLFEPTNLAILDEYREAAVRALQDCTFFGVGCSADNRHKIMDDPRWRRPVPSEFKDLAQAQLGTSGSGNHFVEFGLVSYGGDQLFLGLLSHSGSRGPGYKICQHYSRLAESLLPGDCSEWKNLAWLDMDAEGAEYWEDMQLMGDYAAANHEVIHRRLELRLGLTPVKVVENHHNFAWKEQHGGQDMIVHRKGATPAGLGVEGIIPGTMNSACYIVEGKGNQDSLASASHGAGRALSRTAAKKQFNFQEVVQELNITLLGAGADELPGAYKDIESVMAQQEELISTTGVFYPKIVRMA